MLLLVRLCCGRGTSAEWKSGGHFTRLPGLETAAGQGKFRSTRRYLDAFTSGTLCSPDWPGPHRNGSNIRKRPPLPSVCKGWKLVRIPPLERASVATLVALRRPISLAPPSSCHASLSQAKSRPHANEQLGANSGSCGAKPTRGGPAPRNRCRPRQSEPSTATNNLSTQKYPADKTI